MSGRINELELHVRWAAQTVHQAYHGQDNPSTWEGCSKTTCDAAQQVLKVGSYG